MGGAQQAQQSAVGALLEYISFVGGPHTASGGMPAGTLHYTFTGSNYYDTDIYGTDGALALDRVGSRVKPKLRSLQGRLR